MIRTSLQNTPSAMSIEDKLALYERAIRDHDTCVITKDMCETTEQWLHIRSIALEGISKRRREEMFHNAALRVVK